jgi:hypothetical protein
MLVENLPGLRESNLLHQETEKRYSSFIIRTCHVRGEVQVIICYPYLMWKLR